MKKQVLTISLVGIMTILFFNPIASFASQISELDDGVYEIDYEIITADTDSVSMANDYFEKPAKLLIRGEKRDIQFTMNHSQWTKELKYPVKEDYKDVEIIKEDKDTDKRTIQFPIESDLTEPLPLKMHVLIETMDPIYDHNYTIRFDFNLENVVTTNENLEKNSIVDIQKESSQDKKLSTTMSAVMMIIILLVVFTIIVYIKKRTIK